jgi:hypothetical protein
MIHNSPPSPPGALPEASPELQLDQPGDPTAEALPTTVTSKSENPLITIFAVPKPFAESTGMIQRNAFRSWARLKPKVEVLLIGDEPGVAEFATEAGFRHIPQLPTNEHGTPLIGSAFEIAHRETKSPVLVYCNSDVILLKDFVRSIERIIDSQLPEFLAFGRRIDLNVQRELRLDIGSELEWLLAQSAGEGRPSSIVCKEYFAFSRHLFDPIPDFAIGRGNWDNWMIHSAKQQNIPTIDISRVTTAIHQTHDYSHADASRWKCYVSGNEARKNERLAGGRHLISGSTPSWRLDDQRLRRLRLNRLNLPFWTDFPRFLSLMRNLLTARQS